MKAMVLAAGLGTRLRPLTNDRPKALVEVEGKTLLEITLCRLRAFGIQDVIINVFHFADLVLDYLKANKNFGMHIAISREEVLLDTGGGLKNASWFFLGSPGDSREALILHNVDVLSTIDLRRMVQFHNEHQALATLAVHDRPTSRPLLFDPQLRLCGRRLSPQQADEMARAEPNPQALAFSGIHVISLSLLRMISEEGIFSIINSYLRLAAQEQKILAFRADEYYWRDVGKPESLRAAAEDLKNEELRSRFFGQ